jgi:Tfp pilus assembly protein PilV
MNMSFNDLADSLKAKPQPAAPVEPARPKYSFTHAAPEQAEPEVQAATTGVDPAHWWGALTDQFQHIATHAMNDMTHRAQAHASAEAAKPAAKKPAAKTSTAKKPAARKTAARKR